jgi:acetylglutamate kinase
MKDVGQRAGEVAALRHALPYLRMFQGKTFVVKAGGGACEDEAALRQLVEQVGVLHQLGVRVVLVHGGGSQASALTRALGAEPQFVAGRRVTDERALEAVVMALNGGVNTRILAACRALTVPAIGLSGVDAGLVRCKRRPPVQVEGRTVDYGAVGDIDRIDASVLERLLAAGFVPVVSPIAADDGGAILNLNADGVAAAVAMALGAEKLLVLTGAPGILENPADSGTLVSYTDLPGLRWLRETGALRDGMLPKAEAIERALRGGVKRAHVVSYRAPDGLLTEVFTNQGCGTLVVPELAALSPDEQAAGKEA